MEALHPLRKLRKDNSLTQGELGLLLNTDGTTISQIETGAKELGNSLFLTVCRLFSLSGAVLQDDLNAYKEAARNEILQRVSA